MLRIEVLSKGKGGILWSSVWARYFLSLILLADLEKGWEEGLD